MNDETGLIKKTVISDLVAAYRISEAKIRQGMKLLVEAEEGLKGVFGDRSCASFDVGDLGDFNRRIALDQPDLVMDRLKKQAWRVLIERMELRRFLSIKSAEALDKQLETGQDLPEITEQDIWQMMDGTLQQLDQFVEQAVKEVYDWLRPHREHYKTNSIYQVGERVIAGWCVEGNYQGGYRVSYHRHQNIVALDRVFHALDGKTAKITSHNGPLYDAIASHPDGRGQTDYFEFKCYRNHNLHLRFKRLDLLARFNAVEGGDKLRPAGEKGVDGTTSSQHTGI